MERLRVDYNSSSSDNESETETGKYQMNVECASKIDDIGIVNGDHLIQSRIRQFQHRKGQWAVHIYTEYQKTDNNLFKALCDLLPGHNINQPYHLSLSRCFPSRLHFIEPMLLELQQCCTKLSGPIFCHFTDLAVFDNDDKSTCFIGACVKPDHTLNLLVDQIDDVITKYKGQRFYPDRKYHVTLKWFAKNEQNNITQSKLKSILESGSYYLRNFAPFNIYEIIFKYGNKHVTIEFNNC
ncbi:hypothetical protein GJ496_011600 [Pomphorhynchus laevis]|nr:hypothetical protein GJ496_011600 [Pomphorhynchus laevis]